MLTNPILFTGNATASMGSSILIMVVFLALMYFLLIRPQRKRDKETKEMRNSIQVGDQVTTIGGIMGTVSRVKDETVILAVGSDRVKMEFQRWAIGSVDKKTAPTKKEEKPVEEEAPQSRTKMLRSTVAEAKQKANEAFNVNGAGDEAAAKAKAAQEAAAAEVADAVEAAEAVEPAQE